MSMSRDERTSLAHRAARHGGVIAVSCGAIAARSAALAPLLAAIVVAQLAAAEGVMRHPPRPPPPPAPIPEPARPALAIPPVPAIPGENALPEEDPEEIEARHAALEAEALASPRRETFRPHRGMASGPRVPDAPVRQRQQMHLMPIEAQVADRNVLSPAMRVMPYEMRNPSGFTTLYAVDDRPDVLVRGNGAVYAVFPQGDYAISTVKKKRVVQTLVPPGTMYYIGEPDWRGVWLPGVRPDLHRETPEEVAARTPPATALQRVEPTMPLDCDGVYVRAVAFDELPGYAPVDTRIDTFIPPSERAFMSQPSAAPRLDGQAGGDRVREILSPIQADPDPRDERVEPPIVADRLYRLQRMQELLGRAARQGADR